VTLDILIAEDDALVRRQLRRLLESEGFQCAEAGDGLAAVELARQIAPQCALLDLSMPRLDGFAVARTLRSDPRTRNIQLHCLTGRVDSAARTEAAEAGFETYMTKPVTPSQLLLMFQRQMKTAETHQVSGLGFTEASAILDQWESQGWRELRIAYTKGEGFAVHGVRPAAAG
jgi:CheY-like chemotaxis protein